MGPCGFSIVKREDEEYPIFIGDIMLPVMLLETTFAWPSYSISGLMLMLA